VTRGGRQGAGGGGGRVRRLSGHATPKVSANVASMHFLRLAHKITQFVAGREGDTKHFRLTLTDIGRKRRPAGRRVAPTQIFRDSGEHDDVMAPPAESR